MIKLLVSSKKNNFLCAYDAIYIHLHPGDGYTHGLLKICGFYIKFRMYYHMILPQIIYLCCDRKNERTKNKDLHVECNLTLPRFLSLPHKNKKVIAKNGTLRCNNINHNYSYMFLYTKVP